MAIKDTKQYARVWISVKACKQLLYSVTCYSIGWLLSAYKRWRTDATLKRASSSLDY
jgi:hypothetical protein